MRWQKTLSDATRLIDQPVAPSLRWRRPHERVKLSNKRLMTEVFRVYFRRTRSGVCIDLLLRKYANKLTISRNLLDCMRWWRCYMCSDHNRPDSLSARSDGGEECRFALKSRSWSTQKPLENSNGLIKQRCDGRCCIINVHSSSPSIITRTHLCQAPSELCPMLYVAFSPKTPAHQTFLAKNIPRSLTANNSANYPESRRMSISYSSAGSNQHMGAEFLWPSSIQPRIPSELCVLLCVSKKKEKWRKTASNKQTTLFAFKAPLDAKL